MMDLFNIFFDRDKYEYFSEYFPDAKASNLFASARIWFCIVGGMLISLPFWSVAFSFS